MIPSTKPEMVIHYDDPVCCGQFSDDGNFFYACVKVSKYLGIILVLLFITPL
jgi:WD repeat-containing protein 23